MEHSHKQVTRLNPVFSASNRVLLLTARPPGFPCVQEQELLARISDLQAEVCSRNNRITDLDHEIHSLNETIDTLTRELEHKGKEVLRVRSEANQQIRYGTRRHTDDRND